MAGKLKWGILGAGAIADAFAHGVVAGPTGELAAVGSRSLDKAKTFATKFNIPAAHGGYEALLADANVDAVYVATPHPMHPQWAIAAMQAGKHVLCEKPLALNQHQAHAMVQAARDAGVFFMEAFMYRCSPQTAKLVELLHQKVIGEVRMVRASFGYQASFNAERRTFNNALGGGGILDVGCYPVSMARLVAGAVDGKAFADPVDVAATGVLAETKVDAYAAAVLKFANGVVAQVATAVAQSLDNTVTIYGSEGHIHLPIPWISSRIEPQQGVIEIHKGASVEQVVIDNDRTSFSYEADVVARAIAAGQQQPQAPAMTWADTLGNLATLDRWRQAIGVVYEDETPEGQHGETLTRCPLKRRENHVMQYGAVPGLDKPVSKLIFGCDNQQSFAHASVVWDDWFERGGNAFDTAWLYGGGTPERLLGQWIKSRGVRDEVVIIAKGACRPYCDPQNLTRQLFESLDRLGCESTDLYAMHRDNPDVPVGEFIDVLNEHLDAGRFKAFGGSNWSLDRIAEANAYAAKHGKRGFDIVNNNLSLARMVKPVWDGCVHVSDRKSRQFIEDRGLTSFAWSSQARGYFLDEADRMKLGADNFDKWDSADNRARRTRAEELAKQKGVAPINIAAAYVLCQPFPSFALVGPRNVEETASTLAGLTVELTREEIAWLWGEDA